MHKMVYYMGMYRPACILGNSEIRIGSLPLRGRAFLAPMSGVTDVVMRRIAYRFGASLVISEMVASDDYVRGDEESRLRAEGGGIVPHVVQIAGRDPYWMGEAARLAEASGAAVIDINMGCPAKRVTGGYAGSALMQDLNHAMTLIEAIVSAVRIPVTLKTRLGWDESFLNAPELASRAELAGVQLVTIHGRTRCQFYKGRANWSAIRSVSDAVDIPVIANGDCTSAGEAIAMCEASGGAGVMIGRAAVGRPWFVAEVASSLDRSEWIEPTWQQKREAALEHYEGLLELMGHRAGTRHARKHLAAYVDHVNRAPGMASEKDRLRLVTSENPSEVRALLASFLQSPERVEAA